MKPVQKTALSQCLVEDEWAQECTVYSTQVTAGTKLTAEILCFLHYLREENSYNKSTTIAANTLRTVTQYSKSSSNAGMLSKCQSVLKTYNKNIII